jgi:predicted RNA binding protein with dsRBD fold (UPF0201 family)
MSQIIVRVEVDVNPTESEEKVRKAVWNLFGEMPFKVEAARQGSVLTAEEKGPEGLITFRNILRRDHIRDAARRALNHSLRDHTFAFCLNKQAAFAGHVSFSEAEAESPLGPIRVTVVADEPLSLIDWIAPKTVKD